MARSTHLPDDLGGEVVAPWGYYQPLEKGTVEYAGRQLLYTLGSACIEASCCGKGSWDYARVEGYVEAGSLESVSGESLASGPLEVDTVEDVEQQAAITKLLLEKHPGVRVEFR